jgi:hypothetical protein
MKNRTNSDICDWIADRARGGGVLAGAPGHGLSLAQGTKLPAFRVGSDWRFNCDVIERWTIQEPKLPESSA